MEQCFGSAKRYRIGMRVSNDGDHGNIYFSERFYEASDKRFDAILLLGGQMSHDTDNQDVINSFCWRGMSKKARAIYRLFIRRIDFSFSDPSYLDIEGGDDYTRMDGVITTADHGPNTLPVLGDDGVLAAFSQTTGYNLEAEGSIRTWIHIKRSPLQYIYDHLEVTLPLVFYHKTIAYGEVEKSAWIHFKITAGVRFFGHDKVNPKFQRGIKIGGTP